MDARRSGGSQARYAVVTAGDSGIGKATAVALAEAGMDVGLTWHSDEEGAADTAAQIVERGRRPEVRQLDLTDPAAGAGVVGELAFALGGLDVFVNNAATGATRPFLDLSLEDWRKVIDVDLTGAFVCAQAAARRMVAAGGGGRIINVTSVHEHIPLDGSAPYSAAKGGLGLLTKVMALELAQHGITVNAVAPGQIATPMTDLDDVDPSTVERPNIPLGRPGDAREIAALIAFLASPAAAYASGSSFVMDGGLMLIAARHGNEGP